MQIRWWWSVACIAILTATLHGQSRHSLLEALARNSDWAPAGEATEYKPENIQSLVGKRAQIINQYGLRGATLQTWTNTGTDVRVTLFEMLDSTAAYGWFTVERDAKQPGYTPLPVGSEAFRIANRSYFWQSNFVVKLEGNREGSAALARWISENILGRSQKPPVSNHLPPDHLIPGTEKYILEPATLTGDFELDTSKLGLENSVEIAAAAYGIHGKSAHLILLLYPTQQLAKKYAEEFDAAAPQDSAFRKRVGPLLALIRGSRDTAVAEAILDGVNFESQATWVEPPPDLSLREIILTIFTFIGIALLFTIVAGVGFGGLRIWVKARYPDKVFDRSQDMEIIQLKLTQGLIRKQLRE